MKQKIHRYTYFKGYKKLKNKLKLFEEFNSNESKTEHGEFLDKKEFEDHIKTAFGEFEIKPGAVGIDNYMVDGKKVAYWTEGSDGNEDFGVIMEEGILEVKAGETIDLEDLRSEYESTGMQKEMSLEQFLKKVKNFTDEGIKDIKKKYPDFLDESEEVFEGEERSLATIASEIAKDWKPVHAYAKPYLEAMFGLDKISDSYGADSGASVVAYFLSNAAQWKGEKAKEVKKELNAMLKKYYKLNMKNIKLFEESFLNENDKIQLDVEDENYSAKDEEAAATSFKWTPPAEEITVVELDGEIEDDYNTTINILMSNDDKVKYVLTETKTPKAGQTTPPFYIVIFKINGNEFDGNEFMETYLGQKNTLVGSILLAYSDFKNGKIKIKAKK